MYLAMISCSTLSMVLEPANRSKAHKVYVKSLNIEAEYVFELKKSSRNS
jgi:hypothetical protein